MNDAEARWILERLIHLALQHDALLQKLEPSRATRTKHDVAKEWYDAGGVPAGHLEGQLRAMK
jgi:hypothetical protein